MINQFFLFICYQVAASRLQVLNSVNSKLPFLVTNADDAKDSLKEEIRLRLHDTHNCFFVCIYVGWFLVEFGNDYISYYFTCNLMENNFYSLISRVTRLMH